MIEERLKHKAMKADLERKAGELRLEGKGLVRLLRDILEPFQPDLTVLRLEEAQVQLRRLREIQLELLEVSGRIRELEQFLGQN
jgi:hypothetical protein